MRTKSKRLPRRAKKKGRREGKKGPRVRLWPIAGTAVLVPLVVAGMWWARQSLLELSYFQVSEVHVRGNKHVATKEILSRLKLRAPVSLLQLDLGELVGRVTTHPWISTASIQRQLPLSLLITVQEREPVAVLKAGKTYLVSADAVILEEVQGPVAQDLPTLRPQWRAQVRIGEPLDEPRLLGGLELLEVLGKSPLVGQSRAEEVTAEADGNYVLHLAEGRATLRVGRVGPLPQLSRLDVALRHRGQDLRSFTYVDLRFPGRVILKPLEKGG